MSDKKFKYEHKSGPIEAGTPYWFEEKGVSIACLNGRRGSFTTRHQNQDAEAMCAHLAGDTETAKDSEYETKLQGTISRLDAALSDERREVTRLSTQLAKAEVPVGLPLESAERNPDVNPVMRGILNAFSSPKEERFIGSYASIEVQRHTEIMRSLDRIETRQRAWMK